MHLMHAVGRERLALAVGVFAARLLQVAVVAGDPGGGEFVEPDAAELGRMWLRMIFLYPLIVDAASFNPAAHSSA